MGLAGGLIGRLDQINGFLYRIFGAAVDLTLYFDTIAVRPAVADGARARGRPANRPGPVRERHCPLWRARRARRRQLRGADRANRRPCRRHRLGQIDRDGAAASRLRSGAGSRLHRRDRSARHDARLAARQHRRRAARALSARPLGGGQSARRQAGGDGGGDATGARARRPISSLPCRLASKGKSANAAAISRAASTSASRSPARW